MYNACCAFAAGIMRKWLSLNVLSVCRLWRYGWLEAAAQNKYEMADYCGDILSRCFFSEWTSVHDSLDSGTDGIYISAICLIFWAIGAQISRFMYRRILFYNFPRPMSDQFPNRRRLSYWFITVIHCKSWDFIYLWIYKSEINGKRTFYTEFTSS